ncbi:hypothetical protein GCM10010844_43870 [Deinococcus radiotolerans]|uniref:Uncharacterized protein n=2 Tax=Deinococcus radiotolerans TaxID=1309407 RepID=A0ABQ2FRT1_9DEIO|nr:hypothetical protein GCM10010844_43870 [Deinococcus radiotolerans]
MLRAWDYLQDLGCTRVTSAQRVGDQMRQIVEIHCGGRCVGQGEHRWPQRAFLIALMEAVQVICPDGHPATPSLPMTYTELTPAAMYR